MNDLPPKRARFERERRFIRNRFSPEGYLGLHLTIGLVVILLCGWWFSEIAEELGPGVPALDQQVTAWFQQHARPGLTSAARTVTFFGSVGFVSVASLGGALFFAVRRRWNALLAVCLTMIGGSLLNILLKHFFHRQRPVLENPLVTLTSYGFPSGHTMGSTLFYGLLALIALHSGKRWRWPLAAFVAAPLMVIAVGLSRIYLGAHYLTDVLAAMAAGCVWLALCWTATETLRKRKRAREPAR